MQNHDPNSQVGMDAVYHFATSPRADTGTEGVIFRFMPDATQVDAAVKVRLYDPKPEVTEFLASGIREASSVVCDNPLATRQGGPAKLHIIVCLALLRLEPRKSLCR